MLVLKNVEFVDEDTRVATWSTSISARAKEILLDCLEAGLESYEDEDDEDDPDPDNTADACQEIENLIHLLQCK